MNPMKFFGSKTSTQLNPTNTFKIITPWNKSNKKSTGSKIVGKIEPTKYFFLFFFFIYNILGIMKKSYRANTDYKWSNQKKILKKKN